MKIDKNKTYNFNFIVEHKLFGVSQLSSVVNKVLKDKCRGNILKADFTGEGKGTQWFVRGKYLIKYLNEKAYENY